MKKYIFSFGLFFISFFNSLWGQTCIGFEDATLAVNGNISDCIEKSGCLYNSHGTPNVFTGPAGLRPKPYEGTKMTHIWSAQQGSRNWQEGLFVSDLNFVKNIYYKISIYVYLDDIIPQNFDYNKSVYSITSTPPQFVCYLTNGLKNKCGLDTPSGDIIFQNGTTKQLMGTISTAWAGWNRNNWQKVTFEGVTDANYSQIQFAISFPTYYPWVNETHVYMDCLTMESQCFTNNQDIVLSSENSRFGIVPKIYQTSGSVLTSGYTEIDSYSFTSFIAAKEVLLSPGFKADIGVKGLFTADVLPISPCGPYTNLKCGVTPPGNIVVTKGVLNDGSTRITPRENQNANEINSKIKITNIDYSLMTFHVESQEQENIQCVFYDMTGKQIKQYTFVTDSKANTYQIPIDDLAGQIVICNITANHHSLVKKLLIPE